jgi:hypothetical protein
LFSVPSRQSSSRVERWKFNEKNEAAFTNHELLKKHTEVEEDTLEEENKRKYVIEYNQCQTTPN